MNKILKKFGLIIISILLLQSVTVSAEETKIKSYTKAQQVLEAFGIMQGDENGDFNPDANIKRGDFALVIARTLAMDSANVYDSGYADVEKGSEYASAIAVLSQMKIFSGFENGRFYPNEPLLYEQAMKIMVSALGYGYMAENAGGFPAGYLTYAHQLKLTEDIAASGGDAITRGMAAQLVYNSFDVKLLVESGYGDSFTYKKTGETLLTKYHNAKEIKGTVTQTEITGLATVGGTAKNQIAINDMIYECNVADAGKLLGHKVVAYATTDDKIMYISSEVEKEDIIVINADVILPETTKDRIVYEIGEKKEKLNISGASVIYNGRLAENYGDSDFKPHTGGIELIDADSNEIYEVVKITSYENMIVSGGGMDKIYLKNGEPVDVEEAESIKSAMFETEEDIFDISEYDPSYFPKNSVVSMARSKDLQVIYIKVSTQKIAGQIKQFEEDGTVYIADEPYEINPEFAAEISNGTLSLELGKDYYFSLDFLGRIAAFEIQSGARYGFLMNCAPEDGVSPKLIVRMLVPEGSSGEIKNFYASDKVKINDVQYKNNLPDFTALYASAGKIKRQIIRYTLNADGEIETLETALNKLDDADYIAARSDDFSANDRFELDAKYDNNAYRGYHCETLESTEFKINSNCTHLFVAYDSDDVDEKAYMVYTSVSAVYKPDTFPYGTSYLYDVNENWAATAIVLEKSAGSAGDGETSTMGLNDGEILYVQKIIACMNYYGEATYGIIDSDGKTIPAEDSDIKDLDGGWNAAYKGIYFKDLVPGSIIQYDTNAYDEIREFRIIYMPGVATDWFEKSSGDGVMEDRAYAHRVYGLGKVVRVTPSGYLIYNAHGSFDDIKDRDKAWDRNRNIGATTTMFDSEKEKFISIPTSEIQPNDVIFATISQGHWFSALIYR